MTIQHPAMALFSDQHPLMRNIDIAFVSCENGKLLVRTVCPEFFRASAGTPKAHTSFASLILDTVMGSCVLGELNPIQPIATIKLTVNHLASPKIGQTLHCKAEFDGYGASIADDIAFVTGSLEDSETGQLFANAVGTFMIGTRARPLEDKKQEDQSTIEPAGEAY